MCQIIPSSCFLMYLFIYLFFLHSLSPDLHNILAVSLRNVMALCYFFLSGVILLLLLEHLILFSPRSVPKPRPSALTAASDLLCGVCLFLKDHSCVLETHRDVHLFVLPLGVCCERAERCVCPALLCANWTMAEPRWPRVANPRPPHPEAQALWHARKHTCRFLNVVEKPQLDQKGRVCVWENTQWTRIKHNAAGSLCAE